MYTRTAAAVLEASSLAGRPLASLLSERQSVAVADGLRDDRRTCSLVLARARRLAGRHVRGLMVVVAAAATASSAGHGATLSGHRVAVVVVAHVAVAVHRLNSLHTHAHTDGHARDILYISTLLILALAVLVQNSLHTHTRTQGQTDGRRYFNNTQYDTIRDAVLTCARKPT